MNIIKYIFLASIFMGGCKKKSVENFEYTHAPPIEFPDDDSDLDDLPEAGDDNED